MLRGLRSFMQMLDNLEDEDDGHRHRRAPRPVRQLATSQPPPAVELPHRLEKPAIVAAPTTFIFDTDPDHSGELQAILARTGARTELFSETSQFVRGLLTSAPSMVFLDVSGQGELAIDALFAMGERNYAGCVQLMGAELSPVVDVVRRMGERHSLQMLPALRKPLETRTVRDLLISQNFSIAAPPATSLGEALEKGWVEFWYQPKIDLIRRAIAGVETFARLRHPERGTLQPAEFLEGATGNDLKRLSEAALMAALGAATDFAAAGIHLRFAVNMPVCALLGLPVIDLVATHRPATDRWPGLVLDLAAGQIADEFPRIEALGTSLVAAGASLAIDDFSSSTLPLPSLRQLPITELKLDRTLVHGCADDSARAQACGSVVGLAHHLRALAVGVGIERTVDMKALVGMGCDIGQGFLFGQPMPREELARLLMRRAIQKETPIVEDEKTKELPSLRDIAASVAGRKAS